MATFRIITPLKDGPASTLPPGAVVELADTDAAPLLLCGAIECADDQADDVEAQAKADADVKAKKEAATLAKAEAAKAANTKTGKK